MASSVPSSERPAGHPPEPPERTEGRDGEPGEAHEETGLDLARATARSLATTSRGRSPRRRGGRARRTPPQASGAHPDDRDPQTLDSTLGRLVAERGWGEDLRVHAVLGRWSAVVGPEVAQHTTPVSFEPGEDSETGGRLVVRTDATAWATQMRLLAPTVVRRLNEELGHDTVAVIEVQGPSVPSWTRGRRSVKGRGPRDTYG